MTKDSLLYVFTAETHGEIFSCDFYNWSVEFGAFKLTTVWWLTWITSSPAWIFLHWSAGDCRGRNWRRERENGNNSGNIQERMCCHCGMWEHKSQLEELRFNGTADWVKQKLTFSVVPVITWSPSYVDLIYIPWNTGTGRRRFSTNKITREKTLCVFYISHLKQRQMTN